MKTITFKLSRDLSIYDAVEVVKAELAAVGASMDDIIDLREGYCLNYFDDGSVKSDFELNQTTVEINYKEP